MANNNTSIEGKIDQIRFYGFNNENNTNFILDDISNDSINLLANFGPVLKIGIQTLPGVKFSFQNKDNKIIVDYTGVYELDLTNTTTRITFLSIDSESLKMIDAHPSGRIIIDILYTELEGTVNS